MTALNQSPVRFRLVSVHDCSFFTSLGWCLIFGVVPHLTPFFPLRLDIHDILDTTKSAVVSVLAAKQAAIDERNSEIKVLSSRQRELTVAVASLRRARRERTERGHRIANLARTLADGYSRLELRRNGIGADSDDPVRIRVREALSRSAGSIEIGFADQICDVSSSTTASTPIPLSTLRAVAAAYGSNHRLLVRTAAELEQQHGSVEATFRRLVALCTDLAEPEVDALLDRLLVAVESDGVGEVAVRRVRDFLRRVMG